jgi:hypothetical protein
VVVEVKTCILLFRLALAILCPSSAMDLNRSKISFQSV